MKFVGGEGKSGDGKIRGIDKDIRKRRTRYRGEGGILEEGDISRDEVSINVGRITLIIPLKVRITQEDTLHGFG